MFNNPFTDSTMEAIAWPKRQIVMTFTHDTAGDDYFIPMIDAALAELKEAEAKAEKYARGFTPDFAASNGVKIAIRTPPMDYPD